MPEKYTHRYTHEQLTNRGRNTWKQKEPPKTVERRIFGYEVDTATFKKYNHQNYTVGFCFTDLSGVEFWATNADVAMRYPERAAEARQIMNQIVAEITGKDMKNMKTPRTSADFIDALAKIYADCRTTYEAQQNELARAKAWMESTREAANNINCQNRQLADIRYSAAKAEWQIAEDDTRKAVADIQRSFSAKARELRGQFEEYLAEHYSASPDKIDTATMQLLNSGICTAFDLARLAERHKDNPTMLRIVGSHAKKIADADVTRNDRAAALACRKIDFMASAAKDGSREMNIFDSAASAAERGLQNSSAVADKMHNHIVGWLDSYRNQITAVPNAPAEISAGAEYRKRDREPEEADSVANSGDMASSQE